MRSYTYDWQVLLGVCRGLSQIHEFCFAVTKCIEVVGEATKHIPDLFKIKYQAIPWRDMAGMRDRLVHGYFTVGLEIVWHTVTDELPQILPLIEKALIGADN